MTADPDRPRQRNGDAPRGTRAEVEHRIEQVREAMALGRTDGELKRGLAADWGVRRRTVERYLCRARARNRELVGLSPEDSRADSLLFWRDLKAGAMRDRGEARAERDAAADDAGRSADVLADPDRSGDHGAAAARLKAASRRRDGAAKRAAACERNAAEYQDRIDKLLGNHAPVKLSETTPDGKAVRRAAEPSDPDREFRELLERAGVVAEHTAGPGTETEAGTETAGRNPWRV